MYRAAFPFWLMVSLWWWTTPPYTTTSAFHTSTLLPPPYGTRKSIIGTASVPSVGTQTKLPSYQREGTMSPSIADDDVCAHTGVTLSQYIVEHVRSHPNRQGIEPIFMALQTACKAIAQLIRNAPFNDMHGAINGGGQLNVQGEEQKKLDVAANDVLMKAFKWSGKFQSLASEEEELPVPIVDSFGREVYSGDVFLATDAGSGYIAAFDPLDGSSNVDAGIPTGTIFGIFSPKHRPTDTRMLHDKTVEHEQVPTCPHLQPGRDMFAAGYCLYSSAVTLVLTLGYGVMGFTLDERIGEFRLTHPYITIPRRGKVYSFNEANRPDWDSSLQTYIDNLQRGLGESGQRYTSRYIGSLAGDVHRTLLYGGIFGYPEDKKNPSGKLRLLYEAAPVAFLLEEAGGKAITRGARILDVQPDYLHQRVPCILGSPDDVDECAAYLRSSRQCSILHECVEPASNISPNQDGGDTTTHDYTPSTEDVVSQIREIAMVP